MGYFAIVVTAAVVWLQASALMLAQAQAPAAGQSQTVVGSSVLNPAQSTISGIITSPSGEALSDVTVRARNLLTGQVGGSSRALSQGEYAIPGLVPGYYVVEVVDDSNGAVIGTSGFVSAPAGAAVTAAMVAVTSGALTAATTAATGLAATLGATAARSVSFMAAAAGVTGVVAPPEVPVASPSR